MTFADLIGRLRESPLSELRVCRGDYLEAVVSSDAVEAVKSLLDSYFGSPFKAEGKSAFPEAVSYAEAYGGVREDQTLYLHTGTAANEVALLWPWGSGSAVTLKLARA